MGNEHMMLLCTNINNSKNSIYVLGQNEWGQLGINPLVPLKYSNTMAASNFYASIRIQNRSH